MFSVFGVDQDRGTKTFNPIFCVCMPVTLPFPYQTQDLEITLPLRSILSYQPFFFFFFFFYKGKKTDMGPGKENKKEG